MREEKVKMAIFSKGDNKFITEIMEHLSMYLETRLIIIASNEEFSLINMWMGWADVSWFEWCDELVEYGSKLELAQSKKIICRLHSYEAFTNYPGKVNWNNIDKLVFVSKDLQKYTLENFKINKEITAVIPNGVKLQSLSFSEHKPGFKVAYLGYINYKKGPMLLLHTFKAIYDSDNRYQLYIAGIFQDPRYKLYFDQMIKEWGLEKSIFLEGWQSDVNKWLDDKDYILCSSVLESQNMSVMQAMAKGIKPVIHQFTGAKGIYPEKYIWNTIQEAVSMVTDTEYSSEEYRNYIKDNYNFDNTCLQIKVLIYQLLESKKKASKENIDLFGPCKRTMDNFIPYGTQDFDRFDFDSAQIMLGKRDRTLEGYEMLEFLLQDRYENKLAVNNIWNISPSGTFLLPKPMKNSSNADKLISFCKQIMNYELTFQNKVGGFILDSAIKEDIDRNYSAYMWERGIPASQFLPVPVYMRIAKRYIFSSEFISRDSIILEAPCGFGYGAAYLAGKCRRVNALDISEENISFARQTYRQPNITWNVGDVTALPSSESYFDAYVSFEVFEHLPTTVAIKHFEEAYRVLKKGGYFIVSTPNRAMRKDVKNPFHTKEYTFSEFSAYLHKVFNTVELYSMIGFDIEKGIDERAYVMLGVCKK